ncbi:hypothetical protein BDB00DRAFT_791043 [Zychaea mexicana]|uniref:uncharacterized protein n=1 Tax=Zychaea mexicana TaxID=64656 RepID=UPI0022FE9A09|nr:uncharacterized protein BDB00DRAFT_791043 [Zychaea mexicana]KAI9489539.1 hypothetical protein BDB00DRAFT_791043 [Zychaea mexicana]
MCLVCGSRSDRVSWKRVRDLIVSDDTVLDPTSSSSGSKSTTTKANAKLSPSQRKYVAETFEKIANEDKWCLNLQGDERRYVEEGMHKVALQYKFHHPVHCLIIDPTDAVWKDIFLPEDLNAIINFKKPMLPKLPADFEEYLLSYNGKKDVKSLVARRREVDFDPFEAPELYWAHKAIVEASDLFVYNYLPFQDHSESDFTKQEEQKRQEEKQEEKQKRQEEKQEEQQEEKQEEKQEETQKPVLVVYLKVNIYSIVVALV